MFARFYSLAPTVKPFVRFTPASYQKDRDRFAVMDALLKRPAAIHCSFI
jgi:hypothetical protein